MKTLKFLTAKENLVHVFLKEVVIGGYQIAMVFSPLGTFTRKT